MKEKTMKSFENELAKLKIELADRNAALPAHSIRPHQILEIEELEEQIKDLEDKIGNG